MSNPLATYIQAGIGYTGILNRPITLYSSFIKIQSQLVDKSLAQLHLCALQ